MCDQVIRDRKTVLEEQIKTGGTREQRNMDFLDILLTTKVCSKIIIDLNVKFHYVTMRKNNLRKFFEMCTLGNFQEGGASKLHTNVKSHISSHLCM